MGLARCIVQFDCVHLCGGGNHQIIGGSVVTLGNCYENTLRKFLTLGCTGIKDLKIAHGHVTGQAGYVEGKKYGHAWLEIDGETCLDAETGYEMDKKTFYALGKIKPTEVYLYDRTEISKWVNKIGTYGPWELELTDFEKEVM